MIFTVLKKKEYNEFAEKHPALSIYQLAQWGELKKENGWITHYVGLKSKDSIIAATLLLEKPTPIKKSIFYAPRGFLIDFNNAKVVNNFCTEIKKYVKDHHGFMIKIDPNITYMTRDSNGQPISDKNDVAFNNLINNGFKHYGFNKYFETMQPRFLCRFKVENDYESTYQTFSKSTRKNIENVNLKGIEVRKATLSEIPTFVDLLSETATKKKFALRPNAYYANMLKLFKNYMEIYIASINTKKYLEIVLFNLQKEKHNKEEIKNKMKHDKVGKNLKRQLEICETKINKLKEEADYAKTLKKVNDTIDIGSLLALYINDEGITFMSGINPNYKKFNPKYAMYDEHIKETIKRKLNYVNFYGISGDFNKDSKYYNIYELKKGYNPDVIELLGEFDLIINHFDYYLYKTAFFLYSNAKRLKSKK